MIRPTLALAFIFVIYAPFLLAQEVEEESDSAKIEWVNDFEEAQIKARDEGKMILLDFYSDT
jgi:hypothetical protein